MKYIILLVGTLSSLFGIEAQEIVNKALNSTYYQGKHLKAKASMSIVDSLGRERLRESIVLRSNFENRKQKYYVYFTKPSEMRKMVFLAYKQIEKADDRWLYLPALDLVKRIASSDDRTSFIGSDFFYEDISGRLRYKDTHTLLETNNNFFIIKSVPKNKSSVEFSYSISEVDKNSFLPMKITYFNVKEKAYRKSEIVEVKNIGGYNTITKAKMSNLITNTHTNIVYSSIEYLDDINAKVYTERYLRKVPKKYLK
jgi:hypothetical protein